jgi:cytochrome P450
MNIFPSPHQILNPFPFYAEMRKFHPIEYDEKNEIWGIFRYNDVQNILTDYRNFSSDIQKLVNIQQEQEIQKVTEPQDHKNRRPLRSSLLTSDPPRHSQLRRVISSAFSPNTIYKLKPRIEQICYDMIDNVIEQGHMDLINDLAYPLPVTVIAELLGIQPKIKILLRNGQMIYLVQLEAAAIIFLSIRILRRYLQEFIVKWIYILTILLKREEYKNSYLQAMI